MISERLQEVEERIHAACKRAGRKRYEITLVVVTKTLNPSPINEAISLGLREIGENKVQEYLSKKNFLLPHNFHLIGHLQSNKVKAIIKDVHMIHSVDSVHLAEEISKRSVQVHRTVPILLEVNTSGEKSKYGIERDHVPGLAERIKVLPNIELNGLMTVAAFEQEAEKVRPSFVYLRKLKEVIASQFNISLPHLSMGMSNDYEIAIEEGATIIRLGTALFGSQMN